MTRAWLIAMLILLLGCDQQQTETKAKAPPSAPSVRADYEYQERCGKAAAQWFKLRYGDGSQTTSEGTSNSDFSNHYNQKLNKCFVLAVGTVFVKGRMSTWQQLHDVHENKQYGDWFQNQDTNAVLCNFLQASCASYNEWKELIKPYMED